MSTPAVKLMPLKLLILHGIGINDVTYADDLVKGIEQEFKAELAKAGVKDDGSARLVIQPTVWDDIVAREQAKLNGTL